MELGSTERLMKDIYSNIRGMVKATLLGLLNDESDMRSFLDEIENLIAAETHHVELTRYVGKVERIHWRLRVICVQIGKYTLGL